jgi:hypothetical protein
MISDRSDRDDSVAAARRRLDRLVEKLSAQDEALARLGDESTQGEARAVLLASAVAAVQYARETAAAALGHLDADAIAEVRSALNGLVDTSPQPWGDSALNDLERISDRSAKLLADIWMIGRLTVAVDPQSWSNEVLVQQCLQVVAESHLAGKLRAELEGLFGTVEEPGA